ncbi:MAG: metallopeptidase family protein [Alphaproteobacteria bacterium]|nr:metallopeptidase family protein [Alphaproteobacteria bacterium]
MGNKQIIMNFTFPPTQEDLLVMALSIIEALPEELCEACEGLAIEVEEFPDEAVEHELELGDSYDLLALYRSGREISPGVERKTANDDDLLILYRRPILDMWCENGEDINYLLRQVIFEELGKHFEFSEEEVFEMTERHYQGLF